MTLVVATWILSAISFGIGIRMLWQIITEEIELRRLNRERKRLNEWHQQRDHEEDINE